MIGGQIVAEFAESKTTECESNENMPLVSDRWFLTISYIIYIKAINLKTGFAYIQPYESGDYETRGK